VGNNTQQVRGVGVVRLFLEYLVQNAFSELQFTSVNFLTGKSQGLR
jgi:hypothetical protein